MTRAVVTVPSAESVPITGSPKGIWPPLPKRLPSLNWSWRGPKNCSFDQVSDLSWALGVATWVLAHRKILRPCSSSDIQFPFLPLLHPRSRISRHCMQQGVLWHYKAVPHCSNKFMHHQNVEGIQLEKEWEWCGFIFCIKLLRAFLSVVPLYQAFKPGSYFPTWPSYAVGLAVWRMLIRFD